MCERCAVYEFATKSLQALSNSITHSCICFFSSFTALLSKLIWIHAHYYPNEHIYYNTQICPIRIPKTSKNSQRTYKIKPGSITTYIMISKKHQKFPKKKFPTNSLQIPPNDTQEIIDYMRNSKHHKKHSLKYASNARPTKRETKEEIILFIWSIQQTEQYKQLPFTSKNWLVWKWDLFSFIWFASVGLLWSLCMTDSCVYILGQSRGRGGLAKEARQGAASREKAKVANLITYTSTNTLKQWQRQMQYIK